jgi:hypothetical protein
VMDVSLLIGDVGQNFWWLAVKQHE